MRQHGPLKLTGMRDDLIGRDDELDRLESLMTRGSERLVTLTGPGGIGKTCLALALVHRLGATYQGDVTVTDLATVTHATLVPAAIAHAVGLNDTQSLTDALRLRHMLLVLDNFEHLLAAVPHVTELLEACADIRLVVTSRVPLNVEGEHVVKVEPLTPEASQRLFVTRAESARPGFKLTHDNATAIASICEQLDGVPLAIELASARIQVLSAEQIAARLADHHELLTSTYASRPERHRSLRRTLDWSFLQLAEADRALVRRLAVFAGGASLDAISQVCTTAEPEHALRRLVDHSLVSVVDTLSPVRYRLLEPIRQYTLEHLRNANEEDAARARHAAWCLALAEAAEPELHGHDQRMWMDRLAHEFPNLRLAVECFLECPAPDAALRITGALWKFCEVRGHAAEGERWLTRALELRSGNSVPRSKALHGAANLAFVRGDYDRSEQLHSENLELRRELGDARGAGISLFHLASIARSRGDSAASLRLCQESLELFRQLNDTQWCANVLNSLGMTLLDMRTYRAARDALDEALSLFRRLGGTRRMAIVLGNLGDLARAEGDYDRAGVQLRHSLELFDRLDDAWGSSASLESLALLATERGHAEPAAVLFGAADAQRAEAGAVLAPADVPIHDRAMATLRLRLGAVALGQALETGRRMPRMAAARHISPVASALTARERDVATLIARGASNQVIADELVITKRTADTHVGNILRKLGLASRAQLAVWWVSQSTYM